MGYRGNQGRGGPPGWLIVLIAIAMVFGGFYLLQGAQTFLRTGGLGVQEATARAQVVSTATAERVTRMATQPSQLRPSATPQPECQDFRVIVPNAVVRERPDAGSGIVTGLTQGEIVCVIGRAGVPDWYLIDLNPATRRLDEAYMNEVVIESLYPTPTSLPTVTSAPTQPVTATPEPTHTVRPITSTPASVATATPRQTAATRPPGE